MKVYELLNRATGSLIIYPIGPLIEITVTVLYLLMIEKGLLSYRKSRINKKSAVIVVVRHFT